VIISESRSIISRIFPASLTFLVICLSASEARVLPEGWFWIIIKEVALAFKAAENIKRISTTVPVIPPDDISYDQAERSKRKKQRNKVWFVRTFMGEFFVSEPLAMTELCDGIER
jgi:hypothetical protein